MDARLLFPREYLSAADLRGQDVTLTISRVEQEHLRTDKGTEKKPVIWFKEIEERHRRDKDKENKRLCLNITNARSIAKSLGSWETDDWVGQKITMYPTTCRAFGEIVDCIRIREQAVTRVNPKPNPDLDAAARDADEALGEGL